MYLRIVNSLVLLTSIKIEIIVLLVVHGAMLLSHVGTESIFRRVGI